MDNFDDFPDLRMTFLAILFQTKWTSQAAQKSNDFVVKEAIASFASRLEDDDMGYFYDPEQSDKLRNAGELVGKIANSRLPYNYPFHKAIEKLEVVLNTIDVNDYNRTAIVVSDCFNNSDMLKLTSLINSMKDVNFIVFGIGRSCVKSDNVIFLEDASELDRYLQGIKF